MFLCSLISSVAWNKFVQETNHVSAETPSPGNLVGVPNVSLCVCNRNPIWITSLYKHSASHPLPSDKGCLINLPSWHPFWRESKYTLWLSQIGGPSPQLFYKGPDNNLFLLCRPRRCCHKYTIYGTDKTEGYYRNGVTGTWEDWGLFLAIDGSLHSHFTVC